MTKLCPYPEGGLSQEGEGYGETSLAIEGISANLGSWREFSLFWRLQQSWGPALGRRSMFSIPQPCCLLLNSMGFSQWVALPGWVSWMKFPKLSGEWRFPREQREKSFLLQPRPEWSSCLSNYRPWASDTPDGPAALVFFPTMGQRTGAALRRGEWTQMVLRASREQVTALEGTTHSQIKISATVQDNSLFRNKETGSQESAGASLPRWSGGRAGPRGQAFWPQFWMLSTQASVSKLWPNHELRMTFTLFNGWKKLIIVFLNLWKWYEVHIQCPQIRFVEIQPLPSIMYCLQWLLRSKGRTKQLGQRHHAALPKIFTCWPFTENVHTPLH